MDAPLRIKLVDCAADVAACELLDDGPERRIQLADNRVEPGSSAVRLILLGKLVSQDGIEPSTRRLRVCCSAN
jgi:hypothetical protein